MCDRELFDDNQLFDDEFMNEMLLNPDLYGLEDEEDEEDGENDTN